ncbi:hypothetical protein Taro_035364, partial [Colocasia esculenta]|nr:hypothetical protein [Colocasia esculenta]
TRAWGIPRDTTEGSKQTSYTTLLGLLTLHRYGAAPNWTSVEKRPPRLHLWGSDDTDLDGTTQVPGQSPELTAWLTENLGHPTREVAQVGVNQAVANQTAKIRRPYPLSPSS